MYIPADSSRIFVVRSDNNGLGSTFLGMTVSSIIYGMSVLQVYAYFMEHSSRDNLALKNFVAFLFAIDSAQVGLFIYTTYGSCVQYVGYAPEIGRGNLMSNILGVIIIVLLDFSFAYRIYLLNGRKYILPLTICMLSITLFICSMYYSVQVFRLEFSNSIFSAFAWAAVIASTSFISQFLISGSLTYFLHRRKTPFTKTKQAINHLITFIIRSTILTITLIVVMIISYIATKDPSIYGAFYLIAVRVYSCSFLSMLNSRASVKQGHESYENKSSSEDFLSLSRAANESPRETPARSLDIESQDASDAGHHRRARDSL